MNTALVESTNSEAVSRLLQLCEINSFPPKHIVTRPGDPGDRLYFIIKGSVSICVEENGNELVLAYLHKNDFIGEVGIFEGAETRQARVETRCECQLAEISYERFHQALKKELRLYSTDLLFMLGHQVSRRLIATKRNFCDLAFLDVESRLSRTLVDLCKEPDAMTHPDGMQLHITRQELSRIIGCTREMVGRALRLLADKNVIAAHGKTIVVFGTR